MATNIKCLYVVVSIASNSIRFYSIVLFICSNKPEQSSRSGQSILIMFIIFPERLWLMHLELKNKRLFKYCNANIPRDVISYKKGLNTCSVLLLLLLFYRMIYVYIL